MTTILKNLSPKRPGKDERERVVLLGLVDLYLSEGKPVGSNTLRENGFANISSATIRNYFMKLEEDGFLKQQHSSGGRIPTEKAFRLYAQEHCQNNSLPAKDHQELQKRLMKETREIAGYLQEAAEIVSEATKCAVILSAPRFDQDLILDLKLVGIDQKRCLCVLVTDFGLVHTEILYTDKKMSSFSLKRIESYLHWKLTRLDKPSLSTEEEELAQEFYKEIMLRHIVTYTNFSAEDLYRTGFSKLLHYPDFNEASALASGLSLFEDQTALRTLLRKSADSGDLQCLIGGDITGASFACSLISIPYRINQTVVGAIAILGPHRIPYKKLFSILRSASDAISETLTRSVYKFKITFRQPQTSLIEDFGCLMLEDRRKHGPS